MTMDCYHAALRILSYRFNSVAELRSKLRAKRFETVEIDETLARLTGEGWLDDERFANAFVRTRQQKRIGPQRIQRELRAAGVNNDTAQEAVRENSDPDRVREDLTAAYVKRRRLLIRRHGPEYPDSPEGRKKLTMYLLNQGYDVSLIRSVVKETPVADD